MTHRILIADQLDDEGLDLLRPHAEIVLLPTISQEDLVKTIGEFDALIVRSRAKVTADVIKAGAATDCAGAAYPGGRRPRGRR